MMTGFTRNSLEDKRLGEIANQSLGHYQFQIDYDHFCSQPPEKSMVAQNYKSNVGTVLVKGDEFLLLSRSQVDPEHFQKTAAKF
jgi:hypothetical protein